MEWELENILSLPPAEVERNEERRNLNMMEPAKDSLDLGILVSDIKSSLNFYQNILGLKWIEERPVWFGTMYRLRFGNSDFKLIDPIVQPPKGPIGLESQLGYRYVTFVIKNLQDFVWNSGAKGLSLLCRRRRSAPGSGLQWLRTLMGISWNLWSEIKNPRLCFIRKTLRPLLTGLYLLQGRQVCPQNREPQRR